MKQRVKNFKNTIPSQIDHDLVASIKILWGRFDIPLWVIYPRVFLVVAALLIPFELYHYGGELLTSARFLGFLFHALVCTFPISQMIHILFRIEVNEFGIKCYNRLGGTWFIEWDNFERVEPGRWFGVNIIRIKPTDNASTFSIPKRLRNYEMFKALCYRSATHGNKQHPLIVNL